MENKICILKVFFGGDMKLKTRLISSFISVGFLILLLTGSGLFFSMQSSNALVDIAEEITSQTFFKALSSINKFRGECDVRVWLCQIAKNCYFT